MTLKEFNSLTRKEAYENLFRCCGCTHWANELTEKLPFATIEELKSASDKIWFQCNKKDWLEAFTHHPKIGERPSDKHAATSSWASSEQSGMESAGDDIKKELSLLNKEYEKQFGYIYIVCASGKSAGEMLDILKNRLNNDPDKELHISAAEQNKITHLRIDKLFS